MTDASAATGWRDTNQYGSSVVKDAVERHNKDHPPAEHTPPTSDDLDFKTNWSLLCSRRTKNCGWCYAYSYDFTIALICLIAAAVLFAISYTRNLPDLKMYALAPVVLAGVMLFANLTMCCCCP